MNERHIGGGLYQNPQQGRLTEGQERIVDEAPDLKPTLEKGKAGKTLENHGTEKCLEQSDNQNQILG